MGEYKYLLVNFFSFSLSLTQIDIGLKILLLLITIFYTLQKWWILNKKNDDKKL
jgi:membrane-bound acyltransferase YfiQ involved in biofilm formation|tara:strand:+ start:366 stop:527 length:162 start_codon:yes stop_codon:yes gene_type:complete